MKKIIFPTTLILFMIIISDNIYPDNYLESNEFLEMQGNIFMIYSENEDAPPVDEVDRIQRNTGQDEVIEVDDGQITVTVISETIEDIDTDREQYNFKDNPFPFQVGFILGTNITTVTDPTAGFNASPNFAFLFNWNFHKNFSLSALLYHMNKSFDFSFTSEDLGIITGIVKMEFLQICAGALYRYPFSFYAPYGFIGVSANVLVSSEGKSITADYIFTSSEIVRPISVSLYVGLGFTIDIGFGEVFSEFRYDGGLSKSANSSSENPYFAGIDSSVTHDITFLIGYKVGIYQLFGSDTKLDEND